jgi:hypothetical protein
MHWSYEANGTGYSLTVNNDGLSLQVISPGSPTGGGQSESNYQVRGANLTQLLRALGLAEVSHLPLLLRGMNNDAWRRMWKMVNEHADDRHTWFDRHF